MTQNPHSYSDRIDRRTALTLLGGGLTALAGCSNSSSSGSPASPSSGDSAGRQSGTEGWVPPEEQSEYITDSSFVVDGLELSLELELQNSADIVTLDLLDARGNEYTLAFPKQDKATLTLADGANNEYSEDSPEVEAITSGENTIVINLTEETGKDDERIHLRLGTSVEVQRVTWGESVEGVDKHDLVIVLKNTGPHPTSPGIIQYANVPGDDASGQTLSSEFSVIKPDKTGAAVIPLEIWKGIGCGDGTERTLEFTIPSFWANTLRVSQTVTYSTSGSDCGSLTGSPTVAKSTDSKSV
ncbi:hypothetical protein [Haloarcula salinisoli]|uniref:Uncharacterized protein n=1 Tax=Haloarcula salinisoli TaxID=2487746 RepID=A0A8J7YQT2_9EURY|nr:hypothetical protein [Halomicroarcula salinisoli]MBX0288534.1 hypothetical protein [Halomicroarcula salinisoli]MBX0305648.1 hypothetical protein [Halomicroarcula salinisoli]